MDLTLCPTPPTPEPTTPPGIALPDTGVGETFLVIGLVAVAVALLGLALRHRHTKTLGTFAVIGLGLGLATIGVAPSPAYAAPADPAIGSISGTAFTDENGDGIRNDDADPPMIEVALRTVSGSVLATTTTDATGGYSFEELVAGQYTVAFPAELDDAILTLNDLGSTTDDSDPDPTTGVTKVITLDPCETVTSIDAGYLPMPTPEPGTISGRAFVDPNGDGTQDDAEPLAGITVTLWYSDGTEMAVITTDADGKYAFEGLTPSAYTVTFSGMDGYSFTSANQGDDSADSDVDPNTGRATVTLAVGEGAANIDAGYVPQAPEPGAISGQAFIDPNGDGTQDDAEPLAGVTVTLHDTDGAELATTTTATDGTYTFTDVTPGTYTVTFGPVVGYTASPSDQGEDDTADSDADPTTGTTQPIIVGADTDVINVDAGYQPDAPEPGTITGSAFVDANGDGTQDDATPLAGVTVTLIDADGNTVATTITGTDGTYTITDVEPGDYSVTFGVPDGYTITTANQGEDESDSDPDPSTGTTAVSVTPGTETTIDVGFVPQPAAISGLTFTDPNGDGTQDDAIGLAGVTVTLLNADGVELATATTATDGIYSFTDLPAGSYTVTFDTPATYGKTLAGEGGDPSLDSDADPDTGTTAAITLNPGDTVEHIDAGYIRLSGISGEAFIDEALTGIQESVSEMTPLEGITVTLRSGDGEVVGTETTSDQGTYLFRGLRPGNYTVTFELRTNYLFSPMDQGSDDDLDSDVDPTSGVTEVIALPSGVLVDHVDAGYMPQAATVSGVTFIDSDGDGTRDEDMALANVSVELQTTDGTTVATTTSDDSGTYTFTDITPGDYSVAFTTPDGYTVTAMDQGGDDALDSDADPVTGATGAITVSARAAIVNIDAGYLPVLEPAAISGRTWADATADGTGTGEVPLANVTVTLRDGTGAPIATATTDANGRYRFTELAAGTYSVLFPDTVTGLTLTEQGPDSAPEQHTGITPDIVLVDGDVRRNVDAGYIAGAITGRTFLDTNNNQVQDPGEVLAGIEVTLRDSGNNILNTVTTDTDGGYSFVGLSAGNYTVWFPISTGGYQLVAAEQGEDTTVDSDPNPDTGISPTVTVTVGSTVRHIDAGYADSEGASISGLIFYDYQADGQFSPIDEPLSGGPPMTVQLLDGTGAVLATTTTVDSSYEFTGLAAGTYRVKFVTPYASSDHGTVYLIVSNVGPDDTDSDAGFDGQTDAIELSVNEQKEGVWAGYTEPR